MSYLLDSMTYMHCISEANNPNFSAIFVGAHDVVSWIEVPLPNIFTCCIAREIPCRF